MNPAVTLVEHHGKVKEQADPDFPGSRSGNPITYEAIRGSTRVYVEYLDGEKEYDRAHRSGRVAQHLRITARGPKSVAACHGEWAAELSQRGKLLGRRRLDPQRHPSIARHKPGDRPAEPQTQLWTRRDPIASVRAFTSSFGCSGLYRVATAPASMAMGLKSGMVGQRPWNMKPETAMIGVAGLS